MNKISLILILCSLSNNYAFAREWYELNGRNTNTAFIMTLLAEGLGRHNHPLVASSKDIMFQVVFNDLYCERIKWTKEELEKTGRSYSIDYPKFHYHCSIKSSAENYEEGPGPVPSDITKTITFSDWDSWDTYEILSSTTVPNVKTDASDSYSVHDGWCEYYFDNEKNPPLCTFIITP